jgi:AcrR family transcriptional regulator
VEAKALFAERGIDASLDELAHRSGVGSGTVYRHFPTRDALVRALYDRAIEQVRAVSEEIAAAPTGWAGIEIYLERLSEWVVSDPGLPAVMRRMAEIDPDYRPGAQLEQAIDTLAERAASEGSLRAGVTGVDLRALVWMLGSLSQFGEGYRPYWRRQLRIVLDGLSTTPGADALPGAAQAPDEYHRMVHRVDPAP